MTSEGAQPQAAEGQFAPISRIPDDILHLIFLIITTESWQGPSITSAPSWGNTGCLGVSHVCEYWRQLALATAQLWSYISITLHSSIDQVEAYVARSLHCPLYVKYTGPMNVNVANPNPSWGRKGAILADHSHRLVEFRAEGLRREDIAALLTFFRKPAPRLRRLLLHAPMQLLGPSMFGRDMPALREVETSGVLLAWLPYRNLITMILKDQLVPSLGRLLSTLRDCPKLRVLNLGLLGVMEHATVLGGMSSSGDPKPEVVELPHLQQISLKSVSPLDVVNVLRHLVFPQTTMVDLKFYGHDTLPLDLARDCPSLGALASTQDNIIMELIGAIEWSTHIVVRSQDGQLRLEWEWYEAGGLPEILDTAGFSAMTFPALRRLTIIANAFRLPEEQWRKILLRVPSVTSLELNIRDSMVLELFGALCRVGARLTEGDGSETALMCPNLAHIVLYRVDEQLTILRGVAEALRDRARRGFGLSSIHVVSRTSKRFPEEVMATLKEIMASVIITHAGPSMEYGSLSARLYDV